jgi:nucleoid DNA-binding protein
MQFLPLKHFRAGTAWQAVSRAEAEKGLTHQDRRSLPVRSSAVTKKEIVATIAEEIGLTQLKTKEIVQKTFDAIVATLVRDGRIELRNFGVFEVKRRAPRKARNPRTGDKVYVPAKNVVTFKPGKEMEERVRAMDPANIPMEAGEEEAPQEAEMVASTAGSAAGSQPVGGQSPVGN